MASELAAQSSHELLTKLDGLLAENSNFQGRNAYGHDYAVQYDEALKAYAVSRQAVIQLTVRKACQLLETKSAAKSLRICSIGCGDGSLDMKILQAIVDRLPDVKVHYVGTDIDEQSCQQTSELFGTLKQRNVEVETQAMDFQQMDTSNVAIPPCDLVLAVHVFYYMTDIDKAVSHAQMITKADGHMLIVMATSQSPSVQLYKRFWLHEHQWPLKFSDSVTEIFDKLGIKYEMDVIEGEIDYTECFRDGFQKPHQRCLLEFMTHTKMDRYPPAVFQTCIDYLSSVANGKPKQYNVPRIIAFIVAQ